MCIFAITPATMNTAPAIVSIHPIQLLPLKYKMDMERIPGVALATHQTWFGGKFEREPKYFFMQNPVDPQDFLDMHPEMMLPVLYTVGIWCAMSTSRQP